MNEQQERGSPDEMVSVGISFEPGNTKRSFQAQNSQYGKKMTAPKPMWLEPRNEWLEREMSSRRQAPDRDRVSE